MSVTVYDVTDFNSIKNNGFVYNLEQSVLDIIENIARGGIS